MAKRKHRIQLTLDIELTAWAKDEAWKQRLSLSSYVDNLIHRDREAKEKPKKS